MTLTRRRVLSGLIAAPAVLVLGQHMPVRAVLGLRERMVPIGVDVSTKLTVASAEWLHATIQRELLDLISNNGPIPYTAAGRETILGAIERAAAPCTWTISLAR